MSAMTVAEDDEPPYDTLYQDGKVVRQAYDHARLEVLDMDDIVARLNELTRTVGYRESAVARLDAAIAHVLSGADAEAFINQLAPDWYTTTERIANVVAAVARVRQVVSELRAEAASMQQEGGGDAGYLLSVIADFDRALESAP